MTHCNNTTRTVAALAMATFPERAKIPFLGKSQYVPPSWANHLLSIPTHFYNLGRLPTPIHRWNLPGLPEGTELWIKRDDLSGTQLTGNKVRKLEFLLAEAKAQGADCVITIGCIQSNHCRATAVAARYLNLDCYLILCTSKTLVDKDPGLVGNLLIERMVGANIELVSEEEFADTGNIDLGNLLKERLINRGRRPYVIPAGGSNSLGTWGYIEAVKEIEQQLQENLDGVTYFDDIVAACGSGACIAGLALGSHLSSLKAKVLAFTIYYDPDYLYNHLQGLFEGLNAGVSSQDLIEIQTAKGLGYAINEEAELKVITEISEATGVILDPVYSGKAVYQMLRDMKENPSKWKGRRVLFVHTGGLFGMFDKEKQLQPFMGKFERMKIDDSVLQEKENGKML